MLHLPDPFAILSVDGNKYRSPVAKKTFNPEWSSKHTVKVKLGSSLTVSVYDNKRFKSADGAGGFLGLVVVPVSSLISNDLSAGVTIPYRLLKRTKHDTVTGLFVMSCKYANKKRDAPIAAQYLRSLNAERTRRTTHPTFNPDDNEYTAEEMQDYHSGVENNTFGNEQPDYKPNAQLRSYGKESRRLSVQVKLDLPLLPESDSSEKTVSAIVPATPDTPKVSMDTDHSLIVEWSGVGGQSDKGKGEVNNANTVVYKLYTDGGTEKRSDNSDTIDDADQLEYVGPNLVHTAVALKTGWYYRFRLKASNDYGQSKPSGWSDPVEVRRPKPPTPPPAPVVNTPEVVDDRPHCPFYMSGFCRHGAKCQFSHGTGMQDADAIAAAMLGAALNEDHHAGIALAMAKSLEESQGVVVDTTELSQLKRDLYNKRKALANKLPQVKGECHLTVYRTQLFASSYAEVMHRSARELKKKMFVHFHGEGGVDYGGLAREWLFLLSHELFSTRRGFFEFSDDQTYLLQISSSKLVQVDEGTKSARNAASNVEDKDRTASEQDEASETPNDKTNTGTNSDSPSSESQARESLKRASAAKAMNAPELLKYYNFIGRVIGLGVFHHHFLDAVFVKTFYKSLLNQRSTLSDLEGVDEALYKSLLWILQNDIEDVLELNFCVDAMVEGEVVSVDLKEGGSEIDVTNENKEEYVNLFMEWRINRGTHQQLKALKDGFSEFVPADALADFNAHDLEMLISGEINIDLDDWKAHTTYTDTDENDNIVQWFWKLLEESNRDLRLRILQFVTGTQRIPTEGFQALIGTDGPRRFCIQKTGDVAKLPTSHTCFNRLDIPPYKDFETFSTKLITAVQNFQGFSNE
ncbi:hypothetical protein SARC_04116 [Sphaeroforma arctica JP610]|uniref:E3 ubiquitin-protein ligase n=1 Tax=Sphaeroforma arctica JP610 TaxID=667725 RepID=A0A0L0G4B6_9EUKA|nr:hypothetical protein SARC_04116 [Sphaeroforma arctica JP610]KNC83656.1 hypothetical protein SARC_04116 [Sphaeroforma arctica JP610]|eukprot:XP_014157558.1 hypothetical protein SARC_04116 [Sphaeroforma arctica JP610]